MKYHGANICANSPTNIDTDNIFQFLMIFAQNFTILPHNNKVLTYTAWNTKKVNANIILNVMSYSSAKFHAISSPNMDNDNIFQFIVNFAQNFTILPQNSKSLDLYSFEAYLMCSVMLWSTTVQTFVPIHQQICILIIFSNFSLFLHKFWLFCPKIAKSCPLQLGIIANIILYVMSYSFAKFYDILSSNVDTTYIFHFLAIFSQTFWKKKMHF